MKTVVLSLFVLIQAQAFAPPIQRSTWMRRQHSMELYGLRTFWRNRFSRKSNGKTKNKDTTLVRGEGDYEVIMESTTSLSFFERTTTTTKTEIANGKKQLFSPLPPVVAEILAEQNNNKNKNGKKMRQKSSAVSVLTLERPSPVNSNKQEEPKIATTNNNTFASSVNQDAHEMLDVPFTLPPVGDRRLTELEEEFRDMLIDFSYFTKRDIMAVRNPRMRALFEGVAASYSLPEVYRAFEVLFEDFAPLRVAGRLIYGKLKQVMIEEKTERLKEVQKVAETTGLSKEEIEASRSAFLRMVVHEDDKATEMTIQQLVDYGLAETAVEVLGYESFDEFASIVDPQATQKVGFCDLMVALQNCRADSSRPECNPTTVLHEIASRLDSKREAERGSNMSNSLRQKKKINDRYDLMVQKFREWKSLVPSGDGRRIDVLKGCFVGAESKEIVEALRIVYTDYSALRLSGDLIFKIMEALVGAARK